MATVRDLITDSLAEIGVIADGETASASDAALGLRFLNRLMDSWSLDRLQIPVVTRTVFDLTSGISGYTFASSNASTETTEDGFEGTWVDSLPPDWNITGSRSDVSESAITAGGAKAVAILSAVAGDTVLYRDFPARPNQRGNLSFYLRSNAGGVTVVRLRNLATGSYLDSNGEWQGSEQTALTDTGPAYIQPLVAFTVETTADPRLRVEMTTAVNSATGLFDDMEFNLFGGGAILIPRPVFLNSVAYIDTSVSSTDPFEIPLRPLTEDGWASVNMKATESTVPTHYYYNPTYPEGTLNFWPVPTSDTLRGVIYVPTEVSQFSSIDDTATLPAGWQRMIVKNLALELCPAFEKTPSPLLVQQAGQAMGAVKKVNRRLSELSFDGAALIGTRRIYNIRSDQ